MKILAAVILATSLVNQPVWAYDEERADDNGATTYQGPPATTTTASTTGNQSANQTARSEQFMNYLMGGSSIAFGVSLMKSNCGHPSGIPLCIAGAGGVLGGIMNIAQGRGRSGSINPTNAGTGPGIGNYGNYNYGDYGSEGGGGGPLPDVTKLGREDLPPAVYDTLQEGLAAAKQFGLDPTSPEGLEKFKEQMAAKNGGAGGDGGSPGSLSALNPEAVAAANAAKEKFVSKFNVSGVGFDGGGGGGGRMPSSVAGDDGLDIAGLLNGLKDKRGPASVEGLQKTAGGDPIGVAGDDIFRQVTRRYQNKIQTKMFLPPPPPSRK